MAMLEGIQIQNFRRLKNVTLGKIADGQGDPLPSLVALVGENGSGKSSVLDALIFIVDCLRQGVDAACLGRTRGGFGRLRTRRIGEPVKFEIRYRDTQDARPLNYSLHIQLNEAGTPVVAFEQLCRARAGRTQCIFRVENGNGFAWAENTTPGEDRTRRHAIRLAPEELGISSFGLVEACPAVRTLFDLLSNLWIWPTAPLPRGTLPIMLSNAWFNSSDEPFKRRVWGGLMNGSRNLAVLSEKIGRKFPEIQGITTVKGYDGRASLAFRLMDDRTLLSPEEMSDGFLKMFLYYAVMEDPEPSPLLAIEAPEEGLSPRLLGDLAREFKRFAQGEKGSQMLMTTYSPNFLDALTPGEVWILNKEKDGCSSLTRAADVPIIQKLFGEGVPMGTLWSSGSFPIQSF